MKAINEQRKIKADEIAARLGATNVTIKENTARTADIVQVEVNGRQISTDLTNGWEERLEKQAAKFKNKRAPNKGGDKK